MRATSRWYASPIALALVLLVCLAALPAGASAQAPTMTIFGTGTDRCPDNGRPVAAGPQGTIFQVDLSNFPALPGAGGVFVTVTTPDGRVIDVSNAAELAGIANPPFFFPPAAPAPQPFLGLILRTPVDSMVLIPTTIAWPNGCYTVTAATPSPAGNPSTVVRAISQFRLQPFVFPTQPANLQLTVQAVGAIDPTGTAPVAVNIFGRGPVGGPPPVLHIIRPDGSIFGGAAGFASMPSGSPGGFVSASIFLPLAATGVYTVVASVGLDPVTGTSTRAQFTLANPPSIAPGNAQLLMAPFATLVPHNPFPPNVAPAVVIEGRRFLPGLYIGVLVLPNGARRIAPPAALSPSGNLTFPAMPAGFVLNRFYPTGQYRFEVRNVVDGALVASIGWTVTP